MNILSPKLPLIFLLVVLLGLVFALALHFWRLTLMERRLGLSFPSWDDFMILVFVLAQLFGVGVGMHTAKYFSLFLKSIGLDVVPQT